METLRQRIKEYLRHGPRSLRDISQELRISEREALDHLEHIALARHGADKLSLTPARCMDCGYVFRKRERLKKPGRCPVCRGEHVASPLYEINGPAGGQASPG